MGKTFIDKNQAEYSICDGNENIVKKEYTSGNVRDRYEIPVLKGDVFFADLNPVVGYETGGVRPVVIIQNNTGNKFGPTIVAAITSRTNKREMPTHVRVEATTGGLTADSVIMLEQMRTLDKTRLRRFLGHIDDETMEKIEDAVKCSLGINLQKMEENTMYYKNKAHENVFKKFMERRSNKFTSRMLAAIYLLSADKDAWRRMKRCIESDQIDFKSVSLAGSTELEYLIVKAAFDVYDDNIVHISVYDLGDKYLIKDRTFELIVQAIRIARNGYKELDIVKKFN